MQADNGEAEAFSAGLCWPCDSIDPHLPCSQQDTIDNSREANWGNSPVQTAEHHPCGQAFLFHRRDIGNETMSEHRLLVLCRRQLPGAG